MLCQSKIIEKSECSMTDPTPTLPFSFRHTPQLPELLHELNCSLVVTTYQAGKVMVLSSDGERMIQLPRTFEEPMGLAVQEALHPS